MKTYLVGGAVRDGLLGIPVVERDYVVVGADTAAMLERGFHAVDRDFPVFRHPKTGEEYALARRESKSGEGYRGFRIDAGADVTLEEDLRRRDLTINAMAQDEDGHIVDPFGGRADLDARLLRHVSPAFVEDPLRLLRIARFAAKLGDHGFHVAHATHRLLCAMVQRGDMAHLTRERLWREMNKAMQTARPWRFFEVLHSCGALQELIKPLADAMGPSRGHGTGVDSAPIAALKRAAAQTTDAAQCLAATLLSCVDTAAAAEALGERLRADRVTSLLLRRAAAARALCERVEHMDIHALFDLAQMWRAFDSGRDIGALVRVCEAQRTDARLGRMLSTALPAARAISAATLKESGVNGPQLGEQLAQQRRDAMRRALHAAGLVT